MNDEVAINDFALRSEGLVTRLESHSASRIKVATAEMLTKSSIRDVDSRDGGRNGAHSPS